VGEVKSTIPGETSQKLWMMPMLILIGGLGIVSIAFLAFLIYSNTQQSQNFERGDALLDFQIHAGRAHTATMELIGGRDFSQASIIRSEMAQAHDSLKAVMHGGMTPDGIPIASPEKSSADSEIFNLLESVQSIRGALADNSEEVARWKMLDEKFDVFTREIQSESRKLENKIESNQLRFQKRMRLFFLLVIGLLLTILNLALGGLWKREKRLLATSNALRSAVNQLKLQNEELNDHRDRLQHLVKARTDQLTASNRELNSEISERIQAEENTRIYEEALKNMPVGFLIYRYADAESSFPIEFAAANPAAEKILETKEEELFGRNLAEVFSIVNTPKFLDQVTEVIQTGQMKEIGELPFGTAAESKGFMGLKIFPLPKRHLGILMEDITEKIMLREEAMKACHLASIGEIAAGVAHEINNPVNGVINYAQLLIDKCNSELSDCDLPLRIIKEGRRIANIVKCLLSYSRNHDKELNPIRLQEVLEESAVLFRAQLRKDGITLRMDVPEDLPEICAHHQQLMQVFLNLVNNSQYALNQKYPISDENKIISICAQFTTIENEPFIRLTFFDTGTGIPASIRKLICLPFFTTKPNGFGTGLGLSISRKIIEGLEGQLITHSEEGLYTEVEILLPLRRKYETTNISNR
jgi:nitrogen-specific signal transduction histidine kinase